MKVTAYTPKGRVILDLDDPDDIKTFGGQDSVDEHMRHQKISGEMQKMAEDSLIAKGEI